MADTSWRIVAAFSVCVCKQLVLLVFYELYRLAIFSAWINGEQQTHNAKQSEHVRNARGIYLDVSTSLAVRPAA